MWVKEHWRDSAAVIPMSQRERPQRQFICFYKGSKCILLSHISADHSIKFQYFQIHSFPHKLIWNVTFQIFFFFFCFLYPLLFSNTKTNFEVIIMSLPQDNLCSYSTNASWILFRLQTENSLKAKIDTSLSKSS